MENNTKAKSVCLMDDVYAEFCHQNQILMSVKNNLFDILQRLSSVDQEKVLIDEEIESNNHLGRLRQQIRDYSDSLDYLENLIIDLEKII